MPRVVRSGRAAKEALEAPRSISCDCCVLFIFILDSLVTFFRIVENGDTSGNGIRMLLHKRNAMNFEQV